MTKRRTAAGLAALVLLAAVLRTAAIAYTDAVDARPEENRIIARHLAAGRGFTFTEFGVTGPTAIRGPVYPMLLVVVGPNRVGLILAINVLAGAATVLAAYALVNRLSVSSPLPNPLPDYGKSEPNLTTLRSSAAPWIAAGLFAVWPTQLYAATLTQGLTLAVLLAMLSLAIAFRRTPPALLAAGALAGLAVLTEPVLALPLLLVAIVIGWRRHWPQAALYVAVGLVVVGPWLYRNAVIFGRPMPITSNFWRDAFLGNGPEMRGNGMQFTAGLNARNHAAGRGNDRITRLPPSDFDRLKTAEPRRVELFREWALATIRADPIHYLSLCFSRLSGFGYFDHRLASHWVYGCIRWLEDAWLLAFLIWTRAKAGRWLALSIVFWIGLTLNAVLTRGDPRLSVLQSMIGLIATSITLEHLKETFSDKRSTDLRKGRVGHANACGRLEDGTH